MGKASDPFDGLATLGGRASKRSTVRSIITTDEAWAKIIATHDRGVPYPKIADYLSEQFGVPVDPWTLADLALDWKRANA